MRLLLVIFAVGFGAIVFMIVLTGMRAYFDFVFRVGDWMQE